MIQVKDFNIEKIIRQIIDFELIYHRDHNLFMYFKTIILLFRKIIAFVDDTSKSKSNFSSEDELSNIKNIFQFKFKMHFQ